MSTTVGFTAQQVAAIAIVGKIVTVDGDWQAVVHGVEGVTWYAFDDDGTTTVDCLMTPATWLAEPRAMVIPMGHKIGEGFGYEVELNRLTRGVCLAKAYR